MKSNTRWFVLAGCLAAGAAGAETFEPVTAMEPEQTEVAFVDIQALAAAVPEVAQEVAPVAVVDITEPTVLEAKRTSRRTSPWVLQLLWGVCLVYAGAVFGEALRRSVGPRRIAE